MSFADKLRRITENRGSYDKDSQFMVLLRKEWKEIKIAAENAAIDGKSAVNYDFQFISNDGEEYGTLTHKSDVIIKFLLQKGFSAVYMYTSEGSCRLQW